MIRYPFLQKEPPVKFSRDSEPVVLFIFTKPYQLRAWLTAGTVGGGPRITNLELQSAGSLSWLNVIDNFRSDELPQPFRHFTFFHDTLRFFSRTDNVQQRIRCTLFLRYTIILASPPSLSGWLPSSATLLVALIVCSIFFTSSNEDNYYYIFFFFFTFLETNCSGTNKCIIPFYGPELGKFATRNSM